MKADAAAVGLPPHWGPGNRPSGPPAGWHGSAGGPPPPSHPGYGMPVPPDYGVQPLLAGPPGPLFGHPLPPPAGMPLDGQLRPPPRLEGVRNDPYAPRFAQVPPTPDLDAGYRPGGKNKCKGSFGDFFFEPNSASSRPPDGLMISNVPAELTTLDVLNRHFRQFGEVLKITTHASEGRAYVQFAERASAEAAAAAVVLDRPEITVSWAQRSKGKDKGKGKDRPPHLDKPAENRTLCADPEEQRRLDANKRKRDEIASRRAALLASLTEQLKTIIAKLNAPDVPETRQEALNGMMLQIKAKIDSLSMPEGGGFEEAAPGKGKSSSGKRSKGDGGGEAKGGAVADAGRYTLDLRPKVLRATLTQALPQEKLREELVKLGAVEEKLLGVQAEESGDADQPASAETVLIYFKDFRAAEHIFNQRSELPCGVEWCEKPPPFTSPLPAAAASVPPAVSEEGDANVANPVSDTKPDEPPAASMDTAVAAEAEAPIVEAAEGAEVAAGGVAVAAEAQQASTDGGALAAVVESEGAESSAAYRVDLSEEEVDP